MIRHKILDVRHSSSTIIFHFKVRVPQMTTRKMRPVSISELNGIEALTDGTFYLNVPFFEPALFPELFKAGIGRNPLCFACPSQPHFQEPPRKSVAFQTELD